MEFPEVAKYEETVQKSVKELRKKIKAFVQKDTKVHESYNRLKSQLDYKECEQRILEGKLQSTIYKLGSLKLKINELMKMRSLYNESKKQRDRLQKELTDCMKVRYLYEDHADLIKREMNIKIKEKDAENEKYKKEIDSLSKICLQNETTLKGLREKLKCKSQILETKVNETGKMYVHEKQKAASLQEKVLEKHNENIALKKEMDALKTEVAKYRAARLEDKINEKQRENVMLREEVAILKVELEKATLKFMQC